MNYNPKGKGWSRLKWAFTHTLLVPLLLYIIFYVYLQTGRQRRQRQSNKTGRQSSETEPQHRVPETEPQCKVPETVPQYRVWEDKSAGGQCCKSRNTVLKFWSAVMWEINNKMVENQCRCYFFQAFSYNYGQRRMNSSCSKYVKMSYWSNRIK